MKKIFLLSTIILLGLFVLFMFQRRSSIDSPSVIVTDYKNSVYQIDEQFVSLKDGVAHIVVGDGTAPEETVRYFGNEVAGDFNGDGRTDVAFILTRDTGGSGTFYYVVAALQTADGYKGTNGIFLGDRIAPQTTEFRSGRIIVNYADRKPGEPFTTSPSVGISRYLTIGGDSLVEIL